MNIEQYLSGEITVVVEELYGKLQGEALQIQKTRKEFVGDYTLVVFPLLRRSRKSPDATAAEIGGVLAAKAPDVAGYNVIKGFLNIQLKPSFWLARFVEQQSDPNYGKGATTGKTIMIEYSSPNTNKPLHLGHVRNNLLGYSVSLILQACGNRVLKVIWSTNAVHICKSMLAGSLTAVARHPRRRYEGDHLWANTM